MKRKLIGIYSLILGISVIGMWIMILSSSGMEEGKMESSFHLASEFLMATFCIVSGVLLLLNRSKAAGITILAHSMVIYSVLNAAGYYGERGNIVLTCMFILIFLLSCVSVISQTRIKAITG